MPPACQLYMAKNLSLIRAYCLSPGARQNNKKRDARRDLGVYFQDMCYYYPYPPPPQPLDPFDFIYWKRSFIMLTLDQGEQGGDCERKRDGKRMEENYTRMS